MSIRDASVGSWRLLSGISAPAGPIFLHSLRYLLAFLRAHGLAAAAFRSSHHMGVRIGRPLQFLKRGNYAFELIFFGVQILNRFVEVHWTLVTQTRNLQADYQMVHRK